MLAFLAFAHGDDVSLYGALYWKLLHVSMG